MKILSILLLAFLLTVTSSGQFADSGSVNINPELAKKDFVIFRDSLQQTNPALYMYREKVEFNNLFDSHYAAINKNMTAMRFYMSLRFLMSLIGDGHGSINLPRETLLDQLNNAKLFPLRLWFINKKGFIYCSEDKRFEAGSEIISIDDKPINEIRKLLFQYLISDGQIESKKYLSLNESDPSFQFFYYWLYGAKSKFTVKYKSQTGKIETVLLDAATLKNNNCFFDKKAPEKFLSLDFKENDIALLTIKTMDMNRLKKEESFFKTFLESSFKEIKARKTKKLIIDLRDNGGGEDTNGSSLYSYLTDRPFAYNSSIEFISTVFPKEAHPNLSIQKPNENNFKGECYFLINGNTFSSASEFSAIAKSNNRGKFIGEETGGGYYGNTGGEIKRVTLPYSKITVAIPTRKYILAVKKNRFKARGIIPDYQITPTIKDVLQNKDVQLDFALKLATRK